MSIKSVLEPYLQFQLCYVKDAFLYFTDAPLELVTGDLWEHSEHAFYAGEPQLPECTKYSIFKVALTGGHLSHTNADLSVHDINRGQASWLILDDGGYVHAGMTLATLISMILCINKPDIEIFVPVKQLYYI